MTTDYQTTPKVQIQILLTVCEIFFCVGLEICSFHLLYSGCRRPAEERPALSM